MANDYRFPTDEYLNSLSLAQKRSLLGELNPNYNPYKVDGLQLGRGMNIFNNPYNDSIRTSALNILGDNIPNIDYLQFLGGY